MKQKAKKNKTNIPLEIHSKNTVNDQEVGKSIFKKSII